MKSLIINQPFGLGDIIFIQNLVQTLSRHRHIIFPVFDEYIWVKDYFLNLNIDYLKKSELHIDYDNHIPTEEYLPLRFATQIYRKLSKFDYSHDHTVMEDKYLLLNMNPKSWVNYEFIRNFQKEDKLFNSLKIKGPYSLINKNFGSNAVGAGTKEITSNFDNVVTMSKIDGFTLFDWIKVISEADEIKTVATSLVYLVDKYSRNDCKRVVSVRNDNPQTLNALKNILTKSWDFSYE